MDRLLPLFNRLQEAFDLSGLSESVDLPSIVVVGAQACGKSSVLEALVGRDFLPRGQGIVTRRPLVLQLLHVETESGGDGTIPTSSSSVSPRGESNHDDDIDRTLPSSSSSSSSSSSLREEKDTIEWGEFLHAPGKRFFDFREIREEIIRETERVAGRGQNLHSSAIYLKIFSPRLIPLTLIDLPGLTRVPIGDQPADIEQQILNMVLSYVQRPQTIILAVSAANYDISNSEALRVAREVDPLGKRTIGVLTKLDTLKEDESVIDVLQGKVYPLDLGYVGIRCRSQAESNQNISILQAREIERSFFNSSSQYRHICNRMGIDFLARRLNQLLLERIRASIPTLREKVLDLLAPTDALLDELGLGPLADIESNRAAFCLNLLTEFSEEFRDIILGNGSTTSRADRSLGDFSTASIVGAAKINQIFSHTFLPEIRGLSGTDGLSELDVVVCIRNTKGLKPTLFVADRAFEVLFQRQVKRLEPSCVRCVENVSDEILRVIIFAARRLERFPILYQRVIDEARNLVKTSVPEASGYLKSTISVHRAWINTMHPDFFSGGTELSAITDAMGDLRRGAAFDRDINFEAQSMRSSSSSTLSNRGGGKGSKNGNNSDFEMIESSVSEFSSLASLREGGSGDNLSSKVFPGKHRRARTLQAGSKTIYNDNLEAIPDITDYERGECGIVCSLLSEYFEIVKKSVEDVCPKSIIHFLVNRCANDMQSALIASIYKNGEIDSLLAEASDVVERRAEALERQSALRSALRILDEAQQFSF